MSIFGWKQKSVVDEAIANVLTSMNKVEPDSKEYSSLIDNLDSLMQIKTEERKNRIKPDTIAVVAGNLVGILVIVAYEQRHFMSQKAFGLVMTPKTPS